MDDVQVESRELFIALIVAVFAAGIALALIALFIPNVARLVDMLGGHGGLIIPVGIGASFFVLTVATIADRPIDKKRRGGESNE
ncbi:hypothetical protein [Vibrio chaetopteri]|uniref:Uncharacterized protein n=1 Tax=Vibrio chaetopteri TaxID=3016528 RepID=A0AAU8BRR8_9VIBR